MKLIPFNNAVLTATQRAAALAHIDGLEAAVPFLQNLTPEDRIEIWKMGTADYAFAMEVHNILKSHPDLLPRGLDPTVTANKYSTLLMMREIHLNAETALRGLQDTIFCYEQEVMSDAMEVYHGIKSSRKRSRKSGISNLYKRLVKFFTHGVNGEVVVEPVTPETPEDDARTLEEGKA